MFVGFTCGGRLALRLRTGVMALVDQVREFLSVSDYEVAQKEKNFLVAEQPGLGGGVEQTCVWISTRDARQTRAQVFLGCLRCLLLVMCTHPFAKKAFTLHLSRSEGHERYFGCNLMHRKALASSHQHLMAEAPRARPNSPPDRAAGLSQASGCQPV